jgi:hypothetical protein
LIHAEYIVVSRRGQDERHLTRTRPQGPTNPSRIPVPPEHLYKSGSGRTLCKLAVDETWERFPARTGSGLSDTACPECRTTGADLP